jgi:hypothetical protein
LGWKPALETKTALKGNAVIGRVTAYGRAPSWFDDRTEKICVLDEGRADRGRAPSWFDDRTEKICVLDEGRADRC